MALNVVDKLAVTSQPLLRTDVRPGALDAPADVREAPALATVTEDRAATPVDRSALVIAQAPIPVPADPATVTLPTAAIAGLDPAQTQRARELTAVLVAKADTIKSAGLRVDIRDAAEEPPAVTTRATTMRDVASALYDVAPEQVSEAQLIGMRTRNPQLSGDAIPAGTTLAIAGTTVSLDLARSQLELAQLALSSQPAAAPTRAAIAQRLADVRGAREQYAIADRLDAAMDLAARLVSGQRTEGLSVPFDRVRRDVQKARASLVMTPARADATLAGVDAAESQAQLAAAQSVAGKFARERRELLDAARTPLIGDEMGVVTMQRLRALEEHDATRTTVVGNVESLTTRAVQRLEAMRALMPDNGAAIDARVASVRSRGQEALAAIDIAVGDHASAARRLLPAALRSAADPLAPDVQENLDAKGQPHGFLGTLVSSTTHVGSLSAARRDALTRAVVQLPEAERREAIDGLSRLADLYGRADDATRSRTTSQVLTAVAATTHDAPLGIRASVLAAQQDARILNFDAARRELDGASTRARQLADPGAPALQTEVITAQVAIARAEASSSDETAARAAADRLRTLRLGLESGDGPLAREQVARLSLLEAQTFLAQGRANDARASLGNLDRYSDIPWAAESARAFRRDNTEGGITAALKVGLHATMSTPPWAAAGATLGTGVLGGGIGFWAGGPVGAGVGFLAGMGVGGLGVSAYGVARHFDEVQQAFATGMTSLTTRDAIADGAFFGLNVAGALSPLGGVARLTALGMSRATVVSGLRTALAEAGTHATEAEIQRQATQALTREFGRGMIRFGGRPLATATVAALVGPVAAQYAHIESMPPGPERDAARRRFNDNVVQTALITGATVAASSLASRLALRGGTRWPSDPRVGGDADPLRTAPDPEVTLPPSLTLDEAQTQLDVLASTRMPVTADGSGIDARRAQLLAIRSTIERQPRTPEVERRLSALADLERTTTAAATRRDEIDRVWVDAIRDNVAGTADRLTALEQRFQALGARLSPDGTITVDGSHDAQALYSALESEELSTARGPGSTWGRLRPKLSEALRESPEAIKLTADIASMQPRFARIEDYRAALTRAIEERQNAGQRITGEMRDIFSDEAKGPDGVWYMNESERAAREVTIRDGRFFDVQGRPIATEGARSQDGGAGHAIFVLSRDGKLYYSATHRQSVFHHSTFVAGEPVQAAGEIVVTDGRLTRITDNSGHYQPTRLMTRQLIDYLASHGVSLDEVGFRNTADGRETTVREAFPLPSRRP